MPIVGQSLLQTLENFTVKKGPYYTLPQKKRRLNQGIFPVDPGSLTLTQCHFMMLGSLIYTLPWKKCNLQESAIFGGKSVHVLHKRTTHMFPWNYTKKIVLYAWYDTQNCFDLFICNMEQLSAVFKAIWSDKTLSNPAWSLPLTGRCYRIILRPP